ncbi:MAG: aldo/keto reductase [Clostridia bacterium]|nr:aldo/keto reductase [Clostridia bacterium]
MSGFELAADAVNPETIRKISLNNGMTMPPIGLGTFGSDHVDADTVASAVAEALKIGYRFIDCASCYGNERQIGDAFASAFSQGLDRKELFVLSKLWNDMHAPGDVEKSCKKSIADLRVGYLDCYMVHWPFPNYHAPFCDGDARNPDSRPYIHEEFILTWRAMEKLVDDGLTRSIAVSNVTIPKLELLLRDARIKPVICEMELHPSFQQGELYQYCVDHGIQPVGYSPIGSPARPDRDKAPGDIVDTRMDEVVSVARAHGDHPAVTCLKWAASRGHVPIPFSTKRVNMLANLKAVANPDLSPAEISLLRGCDRNCRLIKGQVFLWNGANDWLDLWDVDGTIPGWNGYGR